MKRNMSFKVLDFALRVLIGIPTILVAALVIYTMNTLFVLLDLLEMDIYGIKEDMSSYLIPFELVGFLFSLESKGKELNDV